MEKAHCIIALVNVHLLTVFGCCNGHFPYPILHAALSCNILYSIPLFRIASSIFTFFVDVHCISDVMAAASKHYLETPSICHICPHHNNCFAETRGVIDILAPIFECSRSSLIKSNNVRLPYLLQNIISDETSLLFNF